jgi:hypothetical protein
VIEHFHPERVFELTYLPTTKTWRAFYRSRWHGDNPSLKTCDYRHADGATPTEAVENAVAGWVTERLTK